MLFGKKFNLVGLDIGSRSIKVGEIADTKKGRSLKKFGMIDVPPGAIGEGTIKDPGAVAELIRELFKQSGIKEQNVALSIGGFSIIVKNISLQTMSEDQLQDTIQYEAEQYIPFDISDVNLDFQIVGESEHNPDQMDVILVAAKKEMVDDYINLVQMSKLNPVVLDVDAFALQNIYEISYEPDIVVVEEGEERKEESIALIDIGASKTSLNILKGQSSVLCAMFLWAVDKLMRRLFHWRTAHPKKLKILNLVKNRKKLPKTI